MPQIDPTQVTSEESQKQLMAQEKMESNLLNQIKDGDVVKSLELPEDVAEQNNPEEESQEEPKDENQEIEAEQEVGEEDDQDEEVVAKSKIQPRFDKLTSQIKSLEQRLAEKEAAVPVDDTQRKLDAMSERELEDVLTQVRVAKEKSRDNEVDLLEIVKLERRIEKTISNAPQKFVQNQISELNKMANKLSSYGDMTNASQPKIYEIAKGIYQQFPNLQNHVDGQAMALELAANHYKEISKMSSGKPNVQNLKAQVNNLKKKTSLDSKVIKQGSNKINLDVLRNRALTGSMKDKEKLIQNDPRFKVDAMIPAHLKGK